MRWMMTAAVTVCLCLVAAACEDVGTGASGVAMTTAGAVPAPPSAVAFDSGLAPEDQALEVAKIGDLDITLKDFERRLARQAPYARARYASLERKKEFLDNLVRFEVLAAEAARRGYDRDPDVIQQMKQTMVRKLMTREINQLVKLADVTEAEMRKYYDDNAATYHKPAQVRVSHVFVTDGALGKRLHKELAKVIDDARRNYRKIFADFAREHSEDAATKARGGDLRFFPATAEGGKQPQAVSDAAFALEKVGDMSSIVKTDKGSHILLLTGRKNRYDRSFEQVKRQIQNRLYRKKKREAQERYVADLKLKSGVTVNEEILGKVNVAPTPSAGTVAGKNLLGPIDAKGSLPGAAKLDPSAPRRAQPPKTRPTGK